MSNSWRALATMAHDKLLLRSLHLDLEEILDVSMPVKPTFFPRFKSPRVAMVHTIEFTSENASL